MTVSSMSKWESLCLERLTLYWNRPYSLRQFLWGLEAVRFVPLPKDLTDTAAEQVRSWDFSGVVPLVSMWTFVWSKVHHSSPWGEDWIDPWVTLNIGTFLNIWELFFYKNEWWNSAWTPQVPPPRNGLWDTCQISEQYHQSHSIQTS